MTRKHAPLPPVVVPLDAMPGFSLTAVLREVAAHYGVTVKALREVDGRASDTLAMARHALFYRLTRKHKLSAKRVAQMMKADVRGVQKGAALHIQRINEFRMTHNIKLREPML